MAEKGDVPVSLEMISTAGTYSRRNSTAGTYSRRNSTVGAYSRRSSMGWTSYPNSGEKLMPNYLRASTGSCHDFCKYGRNHAFETKSRQPVSKNLARKSLDGGSSVDAILLPERKKTTLTWANAEFSSTSRLSETKSRQPLPKNVTRKSLDGGRSLDSVVLPERKKTISTETKSRQPMTKNVARKSLDGGSLVDRVVFPERKNITSTTWAKAEFSSTSRLHEADSTTFSMTKLPVESPALLTPVQRQVPNERKKKLLPSPKQREVLNESKKKLLVEPRTLSTSRSRTKNSLKNLKPETSAAARSPENSVVQVFAKAKERVLPEKSDKILKPKSIKVKPLRSASLDNSRWKNYSKMGKCSGTSKEAAKKVVAASTGSFSSNSIHGAANLTTRKHVNGAANLTTRKHVNGAANLTTRKHVNLKGVPLKTHKVIKISERGQVRNEEIQEKNFQGEEVQEETYQSEVVEEETFQSEEVQEKTLYVIKIENEEIPQQPDQDKTDYNMEASSLPPKSLSPPMSPATLADAEDQDVSEYTEYTGSEAENDFYHEGDKIGSIEAGNASSKGSKNCRSQNHGMLQSKLKDPQSTKLSFRRGKIIDICSESNSPRRLKFRRGRLLGENQKAGDGLRKNFKRGKEVNSETNTTTQETVVLRHQDVQGKKDAQGLFNNVIEETASKLVETRKSKVKALVGAFETVISLQDGKPSIES
ncbi:uncharacterized protein LOC120079612 isoform X2 [Benincasa hispida]|nr:uncharacterized protein LOC120079612 isoform X2 [Benincasa hispida]XP_038889781.1 uncharacterized protein LOC120079612 isoform X2 [Benincasa hispida]XP_038889782.1 uncharacterized protein LOC120079612 isoform X2 [Benincasa hispida]XP_038889783.1 uncharacterized protein LOC120079612 isoform X2 [Benincasa hispida]